MADWRQRRKPSGSQAEAARAEIREKIAHASGRASNCSRFGVKTRRPPPPGCKSWDSSRFPREGWQAGCLWLKPGESFGDLDNGPEMVVAPAGEFWMGSKDGEGAMPMSARAIK